MLTKTKLRDLTFTAQTAIALLVLLATHSLSFAQQQPVSGTSVAMQPPAGFTPASAFTGFENLATSSSITVMELPAQAYSELSAVMADMEKARQAFAAQKITITGQSTVQASGVSVPFVEGHQAVGDRTVTKYFTLLEGEKTVLVTFNIFEEAVTTKQAAISSVESIVLNKPASLEEQLDNLSFTFKNALPFQASSVLGGMSVVLPSYKGTDPSGQKPLVIITSSARPANTADLHALSVAAFHSTRGFEATELTNGNKVSLAGGHAYLIEGTNDSQLGIQYLWATANMGYVRLFALGSPEQLSAHREAISKIAQSVQIK